MSNYTQGVCHDGAAILQDGQPLTIEQILEALRERETLVARIAELERYNLGLANESCELQERVARLNSALTRQANAATLGIDAAKKVAGSNLEQAKQLHAESSPAALESERAANAALTELVAKLEQERDALAAHVERLAVAANDAINQPRSCMMVARWDRTMKYAPTTSLARRDALNKADAMDWVLAKSCNEENEGVMWRTKIVEPEIQRLRQQAEGHQ